MKEEVLESCLEFENRYSDIKIPDRVCGKCCMYNDLFIKSYPRFNGRLLHLLGHRNYLENRHPQYDNYGNPDFHFYHAVCLLKSGLVVDMTNKQLDSKGASFRIMTIEELKSEWLILSRTNQEWEDFISIKSSLRYASKDYRKEKYHLESEKDRKKNISKYSKQADKFLRRTVRNVLWHNLIFTGTEEDNVHLAFLNQVKKSKQDVLYVNPKH